MFDMWFAVWRGRGRQGGERYAADNAVVILNQRIVEAATALQRNKAVVARLAAEIENEEARLKRLAERREGLEASALDALRADREDLAREVAMVLAEIAADEAATGAALAKLRAPHAKLRAQIEGDLRRLTELRRGARLVTLEEGLPRVSREGPTGPALAKAEHMLRLAEAGASEREAMDRALEDLDPEARGDHLAARLRDAGCGPKIADPADEILEALRAKADADAAPRNG